MRVKCRDASVSAHRWTVGRCSPGKCSEGPPVPCDPPPSCRLAQASARACLPRAQRVFMAGPSPSRELVLVLLLQLPLLLLLRFPLRCLSAPLRSLAACLPPCVSLSSQPSARCCAALLWRLFSEAKRAPHYPGEDNSAWTRRTQEGPPPLHHSTPAPGSLIGPGAPSAGHTYCA